MGDTVSSLNNDWAEVGKFKFKKMAYENSCFPCSIHIIGANLGKANTDGNDIETECNTWKCDNKFGDLDSGGLSHDQIADYMDKIGKNYCNHYRIFKPEDISPNTATVIINQWLNSETSSGIIICTTHAFVLYKIVEQSCCKTTEKFYFYYPSKSGKFYNDVNEINNITITSPKEVVIQYYTVNNQQTTINKAVCVGGSLVIIMC